MEQVTKNFKKYMWLILLVIFLPICYSTCWATSSSNVPLDSPIYSYLEKLSGFGLIKSDVKGIRPFSKAETARLVQEAEINLLQRGCGQMSFATDLINRIKDITPREVSLLKSSDKRPPLVDYNLVSSFRQRYVYLDGVARSYERPVHDGGNDGVFGLGSGLRPKSTYPNVVQQHGFEGTPLAENNNGVVYRNGSNEELRWGAEIYLSDIVTGLLEPSLLANSNETRVYLNRGYIKLGGGNLELELGKDEAWLGQGYRGTVTLTNNAENFTLVKLSNPEPFRLRIFPWLGDLKYALVASRFNKTYVAGLERQPWFYALKLVSKPVDNVEIGFNLGRQVGGPGVKNGTGDTLRGIVGGTNSDNSNGLAGFEFRYRVPWLKNTELYGEFSGEDTASFWPIVESYLAGFYIPSLTDDGRNDFRFEFFQGNQILYTNGTFPAGYIYKDLPIGHSQGGATQDFFAHYSHWFSARNNLAVEYIFTQRGNVGRVTVDGAGNFDSKGTLQAIERKNTGRVQWRLPIYGDLDFLLLYGHEWVKNFNLTAGSKRQNRLVSATVAYRY